MSGLQIRIATPEDAAQIRAIYAPAVTDSAVSFEMETPTVADLARRIGETTEMYPWVVVDRRGEIVGYAYARRWRSRPAYDWDVEITAFVKSGNEGRGIGRAMYHGFLGLLAAQGFVNAIAVITLPNDTSTGFHEAMGFHRAAVFPASGFKLGEWHDLEFWWSQLADLPDDPQPPIPFATFRRFPECTAILEQASQALY